MNKKRTLTIISIIISILFQLVGLILFPYITLEIFFILFGACLLPYAFLLHLLSTVIPAKYKIIIFIVKIYSVMALAIYIFGLYISLTVGFSLADGKIIANL